MVVQNLNQHGGIFTPSESGWKNSTMPYPPFLVEFSTICKQVEKSPPTWWNFSTITKWVEKIHHAVWWNFTTICKEVEQFHLIMASICVFSDTKCAVDFVKCAVDFAGVCYVK